MSSLFQTDTKTALKIIRAGVPELEDATRLFDAYRVFYKQQSNLPAANNFLFERIINHESVIFLAYDQNNTAVGFEQLYMSFSSVSMSPIWILNDLYVAPEARKNGVGKALIAKAEALVKERGDKALILETAHDNTPAQALYEKLGFSKENDVYHYSLAM